MATRRDSDLEAAFVREYLADPDQNATRAALAAGYGGAKRNRHSARTAASRLLKRPHIAEQIQAGMAQIAERTKIDAEWLRIRLADEAEADLADLYEEDGSIKPIHKWPMVWRRGLVSGIEVEELFEGRGEGREHIGRVRKVKLADRTKIKELLGKHVDVQAFREKVEHKHTFESMSDDEIERRIAAYERGGENEA